MTFRILFNLAHCEPIYVYFRLSASRPRRIGLIPAFWALRNLAQALSSRGKLPSDPGNSPQESVKVTGILAA
jgi:hypothetical protein